MLYQCLSAPLNSHFWAAAAGILVLTWLVEKRHSHTVAHSGLAQKAKISKMSKGQNCKRFERNWINSARLEQCQLAHCESPISWSRKDLGFPSPVACLQWAVEVFASKDLSYLMVFSRQNHPRLPPFLLTFLTWLCHSSLVDLEEFDDDQNTSNYLSFLLTTIKQLHSASSANLLSWSHHFVHVHSCLKIIRSFAAWYTSHHSTTSGRSRALGFAC